MVYFLTLSCREKELNHSKMEYKFEHIPCNLCGSDNYETISTKGKFGLPTNVVICKDCGLSYLNPRWDKDSYNHFYKSEYDKYYRPQIKKQSFSSKNNSNNPIVNRIEKLKLFPESISSILDIGSGAGENLFFLKSKFEKSKLYAIEPSLESQIHLQNNNVNVLSDDVDTSWNEEFKDTFDIIIMRHVLEHFLDPLTVIKKVKGTLKKTGILYIAVPNNLNPTQNLERSWFRNVHTYYFNKYSLKSLCNLAGLEILEIVEGDEFNRGEIYLIAKIAESVSTPHFSYKHYEEQFTVLQNKLKLEKSFVNVMKNKLKKLLLNN